MSDANNMNKQVLMALLNAVEENGKLKHMMNQVGAEMRRLQMATHSATAQAEGRCEDHEDEIEALRERVAQLSDRKGYQVVYNSIYGERKVLAVGAIMSDPSGVVTINVSRGDDTMVTE